MTDAGAKLAEALDDLGTAVGWVDAAVCDVDRCRSPESRATTARRLTAGTDSR